MKLTSPLFVLLLLSAIIGSGCERTPSPTRPRQTLPNTPISVDVPNGWVLRVVSATEPGIYFPRFGHYWLAGTQEDFDRYDRSSAGSAPNFFFGCVIGETENAGNSVSEWLARSNVYSTSTMLFLAGTRPLGTSSPSSALVVAESGDNSTQTETIYVHRSNSDILGVSYFINADMEASERALLPQTRLGCEQIARSLLESH